VTGAVCHISARLTRGTVTDSPSRVRRPSVCAPCGEITQTSRVRVHVDHPSKLSVSQEASEDSLGPRQSRATPLAHTHTGLNSDWSRAVRDVQPSQTQRNTPAPRYSESTGAHHAMPMHGAFWGTRSARLPHESTRPIFKICSADCERFSAEAAGAEGAEPVVGGGWVPIIAASSMAGWSSSVSPFQIPRGDWDRISCESAGTEKLHRAAGGTPMTGVSSTCSYSFQIWSAD